jgi:predicted nucleic-acid-binding protein
MIINPMRFQAISAKESSDLLALIEKCENAVTNADIFVEDLSRELNLLDGANIHSIMASEENIENLMNTLELSIAHTDAIEGRLNQYDDYLEHIRDSMDKMEGKTVSIEMVNMNNKRLLECLENILVQLDLSYKHQAALQEADFSTSKKTRECILASKALKR